MQAYLITYICNSCKNNTGAINFDNLGSFGKNNCDSIIVSLKCAQDPISRKIIIDAAFRCYSSNVGVAIANRLCTKVIIFTYFILIWVQT